MATELELLRGEIRRLAELLVEQGRRLDRLEVWAQDSERPPAQTGTALDQLRARVELLLKRQKGDPGERGPRGFEGPKGRDGNAGENAATVIREVKISG